ncbi:hypothetical protein BDN71DRAFT_1511879 [Pleurotus eryngii]|uniref:F-box domain-containing protein n=1 Tax=Pleurotus eryngii TaxID=5323 RepID=A0A9P5ZLI5_PLEER|nr:hypothetical protein BDN71DRAFT_1511879 [Pleurotus eryngii]
MGSVANTHLGGMSGTIISQGAGRPTRICLFFDHAGASPEMVEVEVSRPLARVSSPQSLNFEHLLPNPASPAVIHDGGCEQFELRGEEATTEEHRTVVFTCFVVKPTSPGHLNGQPKNNALVQWLHTDLVWHGNMVVVAHTDGAVMDFTNELASLCREVFTRLLRTQPLHKAIINLQQPACASRCDHRQECGATADSDSQASLVVQAQEILLDIFGRVSFAGLSSISRASRRFRRLVRVVMKERVEMALVPFFPTAVIPLFFQQLRWARGLMFGDVPLQVVVGRRWPCKDLHISVPYEDRVDMLLWLSANGYPDSTTMDGHFAGCKTYALAHQKMEDVRVLLSVSYDSHTWRPSLACRTSAGATVLTSAGVYCCFTELAERGIVVSSSPAGREHYVAAGFVFSENGAGRTEGCGLMCSRRLRRLDVPDGIDVLNWGGMDGALGMCLCERAQSRAHLQWSISNMGECRNKHCGYQGTSVFV